MNSLILCIALNKRELTRITFLSQQNLDPIPMDSEFSLFFPVICVKNAENLMDLSCGVDLGLMRGHREK